MAQNNRFLTASLLVFTAITPLRFIACERKHKDPMEAYFESVAADIAQAEQEEQAAAACRTSQTEQKSTQLMEKLDVIQERIRANLDSIRRMSAIALSRQSDSVCAPRIVDAPASSKSALHFSVDEEEIKIIKNALAKIRQIHNKLRTALDAAEKYVNILAKQGTTTEEIVAAHERYLCLYIDVFDYGIGALPERLESLAEDYNEICVRILDICSNPSNLYVKRYSSEVEQLWRRVKEQIYSTLKEEVKRLEVTPASTSSSL